MKNEIEVGMYVRFKKGKVIYVRKLLEVIHNFETFDVYRTDKEYFDYEEKDYFDVVYPDEILKSSYDITDLIKKDDYVNGYKVVDFDLTYFNGTDRLKESKRIGIIVINGKYEFENYIKKEEIKSIVTKEMFENVEYRVETN